MLNSRENDRNRKFYDISFQDDSRTDLNAGLCPLSGLEQTDLFLNECVIIIRGEQHFGGGRGPRETAQVHRRLGDWQR